MVGVQSFRALSNRSSHSESVRRFTLHTARDPSNVCSPISSVHLFPIPHSRMLSVAFAEMHFPVE
jgi:hypothetical protein